MFNFKLLEAVPAVRLYLLRAKGAQKRIPLPSGLGYNPPVILRSKLRITSTSA